MSRAVVNYRNGISSAWPEAVIGKLKLYDNSFQIDTEVRTLSGLRRLEIYSTLDEHSSKWVFKLKLLDKNMFS